MASGAQESSDLLSASRKAQGNGNVAAHEPSPPDGGIRAYLVVTASFLTNGLLFGAMNSYSNIYDVLEQQLKLEGVQNAESKAALVGSLALGTTFLLSPVTGILTEILGLQVTAVAGGCIAAGGLLISSFVTDYVNALCFTYGILYGLGASLAYTPSLAVLGHYFKKHLGLANGVVTVGSAVFTVSMPPFMEYAINTHGLKWLFRILAVMALFVAICGILFKPIQQAPIKPTAEGGFLIKLRKAVNTDLWRIRNYKFWALSIPVALFGYFVPYVHIKRFLNISFKNVNFNLPLQCIGITTGVGRLVFGVIADRPGVDTIFLQQISFYVIGVITIILPFVNDFYFVVALSLAMGLFDGAFISLIGPIAIKLAGPANAAQGIGCMLGLAALPLSLGPPVAGYIYEQQKSYTLAFILAGISPIVGATLMFAVRFGRSKKRPETNGHAVPMSSAKENGKDMYPVLLTYENSDQKTTL